MSLRIYYVDDEPELLELFSNLISSPENIVSTFADAASALEAIRAAPPDLLFLDFRLPDTTGDQIALQVDPNIPKILITGDLDVTLVAKFEAKFGKPYSSKAIRAFIKEFASRKS